MNRRGFIGGLFAVAAVATAPAVWAVKKVRGLFVNVKDHGAKGDGVTNDAEAFRRAFEAAGDGGTVYLPPGEYFVGAGPILVDRTGIRGEGPAKTVIHL